MLAQATTVLPEAKTMRVVATAIEAAEAPRVDGDVGDTIWARASVISEFAQMDPVPGEAATERTEVRLLYDSRQLYVMLHAFDSEPSHIVASTKARDGQLFGDDMFRLVLDPLQTRREGYYFQVNSAGSQGEGLIQGSNNFIRNWNTIWTAVARRTPDGWAAEMAIPFRALSYDPAREDWGVDLMRVIRRKNEQVRWGSVPPGTRGNDLSYEGTLSGLKNMNQGRGVDVHAFGSVRTTRDWTAGRDVVKGRPSATAYYKFNSGLNGLLTFNTDFSDAPLDNRQVNTTRFSLFEEETRAFFLEDNANFEFATQARFNGQPNRNGQAFFSRNIGLVQGRPIDIVAGAKVSGSAGANTVGALTVRTAREGNLAPQTLSVLRLARNVLGESRVGMLYTRGDPSGRTNNSVAGIDFYYRDSTFRPGKRLWASAFYQRSASSALGRDASWGAGFAYPNQPWAVEARVQQVGRGFSPALGFVNRPGVRNWQGAVERVYRRPGKWLQRFNIQDFSDWTTGLDGRVQSAQDRLKIEFRPVTNDELLLGVRRVREVLPTAFNLPGAVTVRAGDYEWYRGEMNINSSDARRWSFGFGASCCDYYAGRSVDTEYSLTWRPGASFGAELRHQRQEISQSTGHFTIHIDSLTANAYFTPTMALESEFQYDNVSRRLAASVRYKWQIKPQTELFAALGESALMFGPVTAASYHSSGSAFIVRIGHRFQY